MEPTKLHFTRIRAKDEPVFFDPATDIRRLLPAVAKATLMNLQDAYENTDEQLLSDFLHLHKCFCIMQIRLAEDKMPCADQLTEFFDAINKVHPRSLFLWLQTMNVLLITLYGMFYRRDAKTDKTALNSMLDAAQFVGLSQFLSPATLEGLKEDLKAAGKLYQIPEVFDPHGKVVCDETGELMENIKEMAGLFISHSGSGAWRDIAEACDKEFSNCDEDKDVRTMLALGLAYPDYNVGGLTLEVSDDESAREVEETQAT